MVNKNKMSAEFSEVPFKDAVVLPNEKPFWSKGEFLKSIDEEIETKTRLVVGPVLVGCHINQNDNLSFKKFEEEEVIKKTGYHAEVMRSHGCGISSLFMVLFNLAGKEFRSKFKTVGEFAISVLGLHRNDRVEEGERIIGTPVFNLHAGWYHDALVYAAVHFAGISGFRVEGVFELEKIAGQMKKLLDEGKEALVIISVSNKFWRLPTETSSIATHMVVVGGFEFDEYGKLKRICVTDPYVGERAKINEWVEVDDRIREAFCGKALFFYK